MGSNSTRANFLYGIEKPYLKMNTIYISKFRYTPIINSKYEFENVSVVTREGPSQRLALSKGGSRGNIES